MGLACMTATGFEAAIFYLAAYYFMNLGAFGFLLYFQGVTGTESIESLKGLGWKAPLVSITMVAFLVSLTGLPPTIGFFGKYLLFVEGVQAGLTWLVVVAAINSVVSLFYYFRVAKALFLAAPSDATPRPQPWFAGLLAALGVLTIVGGLWNKPLQEWSKAGQESLGLDAGPADE
jgi:NADH-quinone oxidoreductase subunit N